MFGIEAALYPKIFHGFVFVLCLFIVLKQSLSSNNNLLLRKQSMQPMFVIGFVIILFLGLRPVSGRVFIDMAAYAYSYQNPFHFNHGFDFSAEWLFDTYTFFCRSIGLSVNHYFLGIELGYIGCLLLVCKKLLWESTWVAMLFFISSFSFFSYGTNTIRNGLACSLVALAITLLAQNKRYFISLILLVLAMGVHRSVLLPGLACLLAVAIVRNPKRSLFVWSGTIPLSLLFGGKFVNFFASLGFDDRMEQYSIINLNEKFSSYGFRWDFLIYSSLPVLLTWYVHKRVDETGGYREDGSTALADADSMRVFNILSGTYILANAFWILVINANFSDRFAYLSWFLYPIVIAYGFIRLHLWPDQDRKCAWALLAQSCFTLMMFLRGL